MNLSGKLLARATAAGALFVMGLLLVGTPIVLGLIYVANGIVLLLQESASPASAMIVGGVILVVFALLGCALTFYLAGRRHSAQADMWAQSHSEPAQSDGGFASAEMTLLALHAGRRYVEKNPEKAAFGGVALGVILGMYPKLGRDFIEMTKDLSR